jgi:hypothetical protein
MMLSGLYAVSVEGVNEDENSRFAWLLPLAQSPAYGGNREWQAR